MKKYFILVISLLILFPCVVNAKEYCKVLSGDGKSAGTELSCGTEHFYIVENKNNTISMLAKYNLYVGYNYYEDHEELIETSKVLQSEKAIGAHGGELGHPEYPEIGITKFYVLNSNFISYGEPYGNNFFVDAQLEPESPDGAYAKMCLNSYKESLEEIGIEISDINLITVSEINELVKNVTGKYLPLDEWSENVSSSINYGGDTYVSVIGSLKNELPDKYRWLWQTTYWTRTIKPESNSNYFIDTLGDLCNAYECSVAVGAGIRPLVTMSNSNIEYLIRTKTDGHGTIEVIDHSPGGETIKFRVNSDKGYELDSVTIITDAGEKVSFKEGEIQKNSDGTMSIDKNNFTMPFDNVTIEARWRLDILNPNTGVETLLGIFIIVVSVISMTVIIRKKDKNKEELEII